MYFVHVVDSPNSVLARPLRFRLGPYARRDQAEAIATRARVTNDGTETEIIETDGNPRNGTRVS